MGLFDVLEQLSTASVYMSSYIGVYFVYRSADKLSFRNPRTSRRESGKCGQGHIGAGAYTHVYVFLLSTFIVFGENHIYIYVCVYVVLKIRRLCGLL